MIYCRVTFIIFYYRMSRTGQCANRNQRDQVAQKQHNHSNKNDPKMKSYMKIAFPSVVVARQVAQFAVNTRLIDCITPEITTK